MKRYWLFSKNKKYCYQLHIKISWQVKLFKKGNKAKAQKCRINKLKPNTYFSVMNPIETIKKLISIYFTLLNVICILLLYVISNNMQSFSNFGWNALWTHPSCLIEPYVFFFRTFIAENETKLLLFWIVIAVIFLLRRIYLTNRLIKKNVSTCKNE